MIIDGKKIKIEGKLFKIAKFEEEWDLDIEDPENVCHKIKASDTGADLFTFSQRLPDSKPQFGYYMEWDSVAAISTCDYNFWLKNQVAKNSRKKIRFAQRKGIEIRLCNFDDDLVNGILKIYHESPIIQGKPNRQYNTDFKTAWKLNSTFLDRAIFIGAFFKNELIAYIKLVDAGKFMRTMGILSKKSHNGKAPMNYLISEAVKYCIKNGLQYLTYAKFDYGKKGSETLKKFKKNMGFENTIVPRYYIPLNNRGIAILKFGLHKDLVEYMPENFVRYLLRIRSLIYLKYYSLY
jgi:hypothetical protein